MEELEHKKYKLEMVWQLTEIKLVVIKMTTTGKKKMTKTTK